MPVDSLMLAITGADKSLSQSARVAAYLKACNREFASKEDEGKTIYVFDCPIVEHEKHGKAYIICFGNGWIHAGCHADKCDGKGWGEFQSAFGLVYDAWVKDQGLKPVEVKEEKLSPVDTMVQQALDAGDDFFIDARSGTPCVQTVIRSVNEIVPISSKKYQAVLRLRFGSAPKTEWVRNTQEQLAAIASERGEERRVFIRQGHHGGKLYIDICDPERHVVEVTDDGWRIITAADCPIAFKRSQSALPLPIPVTGGSIHELRQFVNIKDEDFVLFVGVILMAFHPRGPHIIAQLIGPSGSAKSTMLTVLRWFIDPSRVDRSELSKDGESLMIAILNRWLLSFDNLNHLTQDQTDQLCRISTGGASSRRTKFSDSEETIFMALNPIVFTGIRDVLTAPDVLDRAVRFSLQKLPSTKSEITFYSELEAAQSKIMGALLDGLSCRLRNLPKTVIPDAPRMVEFACWGTAAEEGMGFKSGDFMSAYRRNISQVVDVILDSDLAAAVVALKEFKGSAKELAQELIKKGVNSFGVSPGECKKLVGELRELAAALAKRGVIVDCDGALLNGRKVIRIKSVNS